MVKFSKDLGRNILLSRELLSLKQDELAAISNVKQETISKIETGATPNPQLETVLKICDALNMDLTELVYGNH